MPELTIDQLTLALAIVAGVAAIALLLLVVMMVRVSRIRRDQALLRGSSGERDVVAAVAKALRRVEEMDKRIDSVWAQQQGQEEVGRRALQRFGVVRYDAFEEMGGRLSFSIALLDDHGDGVVVTSINGRTEARTYAKTVRNLASEHHLSEEERKAMSIAMSAREGRSPTAVGEAR